MKEPALTPSAGRTAAVRMCLLSGAILSWSVASLTRAQAVSEADVIRIVRARDPEVRVAHEVARASEAAEAEATLYPNPQLAWEGEHLPGGNPLAERQDSFVLSVPLAFSGRRAALLGLARSEAASAQVTRAQIERDAVVRALSSFYRALAAEERVRVQSAAHTRLAEAARVLGHRFAEGAASGYEYTRIELEAELSLSELREVESRALLAKAELSWALGKKEKLELRGSLAPTTIAKSGPEQPPSLAFARAAAASAAEAEKASGSAWIPALQASAGLRIDRAQQDTAYGYVAGLSIELPLFSRGQELSARASARKHLAQAQTASLIAMAARETLEAKAQRDFAREELARFEQGTGQRVDQLERAAQSAYREGQRSVLELLDAERARTAVALRRLELLLAGKLAELALRAATGEFE